jgi:hypothetical protein
MSAAITVALMAKQTFIVDRSRKDSRGNVVGLCGNGWSLGATEAIIQIRNQTHEYRVLRADGPFVRPYGEGYLRSDKDLVTGNNLDSLPDC